MLRGSPLQLVLLTLAACSRQAPITELSPPSLVDAGLGADGGLPDSSGAPLVDAGTPADSGTRPDAGPRLPLRQRLEAIDEVTIVERATLPDGVQLFDLRISQPQDHDRPDGRRFDHRVVLRHKDEARPMVLHTTGYDLFGRPFEWADRESEPAVLLDANELIVEHRFFGESFARPLDWSTLTVAQSAADTHAIVELLRPIYTGPWIGTGVSKGGMTSIFHHHHYPDDFAAIVPYVAPISFGLADLRYLEFLTSVGPTDGACRERVRAIARAFVLRRTEIAQALRVSNRDLAFYPQEAVEAAVAARAFSFEWSFWQRYGSVEGCAALPDPQGPANPLSQFAFVTASELSGGDPGREFRPYTYQVLAELGTPVQSRDEIAALARDVDFSYLPSRPPPPWGPSPVFDPGPMLRVDAWLRDEATRIVGIYGAWDPWTGGIPTVNSDLGNRLFIVPEASHYAQMSLLPARDQRDAFDRLEGLVGVEIRGAGGLLESAAVTRHQRVVQAVLRAEDARP